MNENTCVCCGEPIPEGRQVCPKCENDGGIGMELVFDEESGTWGEAPEVYGVINCPTKEDYEYALNAIKSYKQLEDKHWSECRQIAHYEDELRKAKELLKKLEDTIDDLCNDVSDSPCGCDCCSYVDTINEDECCEVHRLRAEALALIGEDTNVPAREEGEQNDT